jgi:hypothetical protein
MNKEDRLAARADRKVKTRIKTLITPFPISSAVFGDDVRGPILRYMFPCSGTITKGVVRLGSKPKVDVEVTIDFLDVMHRYDIEAKVSDLVVNVPVSSGDCLTISIDSENPITEVWISFLWEPNTSEVSKESYYEITPLLEGGTNEGV